MTEKTAIGLHLVYSRDLELLLNKKYWFLPLWKGRRGEKLSAKKCLRLINLIYHLRVVFSWLFRERRKLSSLASFCDLNYNITKMGSSCPVSQAHGKTNSIQLTPPLTVLFSYLTVQALPQHLEPALKFLLYLLLDEQLRNFPLHKRSTLIRFLWAAIGWNEHNSVTATNNTTSFIWQQK